MTTPTEARKSLSQCGTCTAQPISDWQGNIQLPPVIATYYRDVGPCNIELSLAGGNPTILPSLASLWDYQLGYRMYDTGERIDDWPEEWLVVAEAEGDALIYDGQVHCILHAVDAIPSGPPLFDSIYTMAACLGMLETIRGEPFLDEDCLILPKYREPAIASIEGYMGSRAKAERVLDLLGYEFGASNETPRELTDAERALIDAQNAASQRRVAMHQAVELADVYWKQKNYNELVSILGQYDGDLDKIAAARLKYARKKATYQK